MTPSFETRDPDWLAAGAAQGRILSRVVPLPLETVSPSRALGRALAEDVRARATRPPWDNSAMDGYAVRGADVEGAREEQPARLTVVGRAAPGDPSARDPHHDGGAPTARTRWSGWSTRTARSRSPGR